MSINIIDPHLHLFNRSLGDYHWLKSQQPPFWPDKHILQQDFFIDDINNLLAHTAIKLAGFVHIEAGFDNDQPWREIEYIESLTCQANKTIANIDLLVPAADFQKKLHKLQQYSSLTGARHILDEQALTVLSQVNAQQNFAHLNTITDFIFELQLSFADQASINVVPLLKQTIAANKQLRFVINHAGFPPTVTSPATAPTQQVAWQLWQQHISELANYPNVFIKCSGWEMTDRHYQLSWFSEVTRFCIDSFAINRVMLASNFPLCLLGKRLGEEKTNAASKPANEEIGEEATKALANKSYASYWQDILASSLMKACSEHEKNALLYHNAFSIYKL